MNIGERIKIRRKELDLTVDEVARRLDKNRATIYRYESNEIENLPINIIEPLAKVLNTTPGYLMGWENDSTDTLSGENPVIKNTSTRLKQIMQEKGLRQVDLIELLKPFCNKYNIKINKSDISQYLSGKVKPGQEKLAILGMALNVNESWLIGLDVAKDRTDATHNSLTSNEKTLLLNYSKLNSSGKNKLIDYSNDLVETPKFIEPENNVVELPAPSATEELASMFNNIAAHDDGLTADEKAEADKRALAAIKKLKR